MAARNHVARLVDTVRRTIGDHDDNPRCVGPPRGAANSIEGVQLGLRSVPATRSDETSSTGSVESEFIDSNTRRYVIGEGTIKATSNCAAVRTVPVKKISTSIDAMIGRGRR